VPALRTLIDWLSERGQLILWDEPDKFYTGELLEAVDLRVFPNRVKQQFEIPMRCDPFAFGPQEIQKIHTGINAMEYSGTAEAPAQIIIRNPNPHPVTRIRIVGIQHY